MAFVENDDSIVILSEPLDQLTDSTTKAFVFHAFDTRRSQLPIGEQRYVPYRLNILESRFDISRLVERHSIGTPIRRHYQDGRFRNEVWLACIQNMFQRNRAYTTNLLTITLPACCVTPPPTAENCCICLACIIADPTVFIIPPEDVVAWLVSCPLSCPPPAIILVADVPTCPAFVTILLTITRPFGPTPFLTTISLSPFCPTIVFPTLTGTFDDPFTPPPFVVTPLRLIPAGSAPRATADAATGLSKRYIFSPFSLTNAFKYCVFWPSFVCTVRFTMDPVVMGRFFRGGGTTVSDTVDEAGDAV
ncbi:hypothetical protein GCK72_011034 [Caenorhabditis remanei]|uniref:Uncharacterized protein n=1 Tax=Caenorhabditis remanei TaxID=31234 RepID=A0A6A5H7A6_CAERE|nr:hypothetical protein GCK72_011034 [Caenorhabditis remanei]KAF1762771.1 hypothetical protein GCK72_011034 [Caenorhabditis remanei]